MHHVHHDLIVAWAKGAKIEFWNDSKDRWENSSTPQWTVSSLYRIKPEPKPDVVLYACAEMRTDIGITARIGHSNATIARINTDNVMFIFDGETGKLKDAQVLVSSGE
jgi:hypothetical protein